MTAPDNGVPVRLPRDLAIPEISAKNGLSVAVFGGVIWRR